MNVDDFGVERAKRAESAMGNSDYNNIPVIDLFSTTDSGDAVALADIAATIGSACEEWGFFQVTNHGVPPEKREMIELAARRFFSLPTEEKRKVRRDEANPLGFYDAEHTKNVPDWKEIFDFTVEDPLLVPASPNPCDREIREFKNQWPENPPEFRQACAEYTQDMVKLAHKLLELICLSLGLPKDRLGHNFRDQTSFLRLNYYPACPNPGLTLGVGPHKDSSALTILAQDDVAGLQVKRKSDGEWILVHPNPEAFVINVGDVLQVWSNDRYHSVEHRVKANPEKARFSMPFFFDPSHYVEIKPLDELVGEGKNNPPKYKAYNYGKYLSHRRLSDFKKLNVDNIQIEHFKT